MTPYIQGLLSSAAQKYGLDPSLLSRVAMTESAGNPSAVSPKGAVGVMQLMPGTARDLGVDPTDPAQNIDGGARYLKQQLDRFGSPELAAAAYNAGPGRVARAGGIPNISETQAYAAKVTGNAVSGNEGRSTMMGGSGADIFGMGAPDAPQKGGSGADIFADAPAAAPKMDMGAPFPSAASVKALGRPTVATDVRKSFGSGAAQGATALPFAPGDILNAWGRGIDWIGEHVLGVKMPQMNYAHENGLADSQDANAVRQKVLGQDYAPQTVPGQYARTAGQFLPGALLPGSAAVRAGNVVLPAIASETAGQATKGTPYEGAARFAGGLVGGAFAPGAVEAAATLPQRARAAAAVKPDLRVAQAIATAAQRDSISPADLVAAAKANPQRPAFQAGGENLTGLAEVAAQSPGSARQTIIDAVRQHQGAVPDQVKSDITAALGGKGDYFASLDKLMEQRKAAAMPSRDAAFSKPLDPQAYQDNIAPVLSRVPQSAVGFAAKLAEMDGRNPTELGLVTQTAPDGSVVGAQIEHPTLETLHYIKKGMDQDLNQYRDGLGRLNLEGQPLAASLSNVRSDLGKAMRQASPDYDKFMQTWGDESDHVEALRLGRNVFSSTPEMGVEQLSKKVADMNPASRDLFAKGVGEALIAQVRSLKGGVGTMRQLLRSEEYRDRVALAFPTKQSYSKFIDAASQRVREQERNNQVVGNSRTFGREAAAADLQAQPLHPADVLGTGAELLSHPPALAGKSLKLALKSLPRKDRSIVGDPRTNLLLGQALTSPDELQRQLELLQNPPRLWTGQAPQASLPGAALAGLLAR